MCYAIERTNRETEKQLYFAARYARDAKSRSTSKKKKTSSNKIIRRFAMCTIECTSAALIFSVNILETFFSYAAFTQSTVQYLFASLRICT